MALLQSSFYWNGRNRNWPLVKIPGKYQNRLSVNMVDRFETSSPTQVKPYWTSSGPQAIWSLIKPAIDLAETMIGVVSTTVGHHSVCTCERETLCLSDGSVCSVRMVWYLEVNSHDLDVRECV
jgi:hypothetical protein